MNDYSNLLSDNNSVSSPQQTSLKIGHMNNRGNIVDDSQGEESTCSSTFHIDSPPSTAEFCQYFHASSSSGYYKNAIETGFAQLTLTDDEQRELYEAALVIQNAYRRYIQRKKKKIRLDLSPSNEPLYDVDATSELPNLNTSRLNFQPRSSNNEEANIYSVPALSSHNYSENSMSRSSSVSLSSLESSNSFKSLSKNPSSLRSSSVLHSQNISAHRDLASSASSGVKQKQHLQQSSVILSDDDENNSSSGEDHKQYEAACVIQKYYRRYKQVSKI